MRSNNSDFGDFGAADPYLPVEEVARRLDLPLGILLRRVEAGDVPSRREIGALGVSYSVRLSDLGFDPGTTGRIDPSPVAVPAPVPESAPVDMVGSAQNWPLRPPDNSPSATLQQLGPVVATVPPPPAPPSTELRPVEPRSELAAMTIDPRELVAGLLDRWERTLEQRIYAEQRMRFEAELNNRQNLVKQLQLELQTSRAEQAAALSERDRRLAETERRTADLQGQLATANEAAAAKRRGLFRR
jgi:hypothetical protein